MSGVFVVCPHMYSSENANLGKSDALLQREVNLIETAVPCKRKLKTFLFYLRKIRKILHDVKISVAIVYDPYGCCTIPYLKMKGVKVIYAERNSGEGVVNSRILKECVSMADVITTNSSFAEELMKSCFARPVYFIKNGIEEVQPHKTKNEEQTIIVPARIAEIKNQKVVLQFLLNCKDFSGKVVFAGKIEDEKYYSELQEFVDKYELHDRAEFKGFVSNMDELYCRADLVILPSYVEGMSNTILECFMRKIPIIVSNIPMNLITKNLETWSFSPGSFEELEDVFSQWIRLSEDEKNLLLEENRSYVLTEHSIEKMINSYQSIIEEMTKNEKSNV